MAGNGLYDWGTPEEMAERWWQTGDYLNQAGYQNPNDRMNRGELPKTYKAEMDLNDRAYKAYINWVRNSPEGREFAIAEGSPTYIQEIERTPKPTGKSGPIESPSRMATAELGAEVLPKLPNNYPPDLRAPNLYSSLGYTYPEFVEEYYNYNGELDNRPWKDERFYGEARSSAEWDDYMRKYYSELPEDSIRNAKTWKERNRDYIDRFERQENLELPTTHFEVSKIQPQRLYEAERANKLDDSYRRYMNGQRNGGSIGYNGMYGSYSPSEDINGRTNWKKWDPFDTSEGLRNINVERAIRPPQYNAMFDDFGEIPIDLKATGNRLDNIKANDAPEIQGMRKGPEGNATGDEMFSEAELNEATDNPKNQTTQKAPKKNKKIDLVDEYYEGEMPKQIERAFEKANYKQNKIDNTQRAFEEFKAQRAGAKPYGNPYSKEGMRYQNGSGQRAPYFNASAFGTFAPAAHALNSAYQHPTQATIATGLGLTGIAASNLIHSGMDAAMAYEAASQMVADAQAKYQDFIANGYGEEAAAYFSGLADLIAQQRAESGID